MSRIRIGDRWIGEHDPVYYIADIAANHDGDLERAKSLIRLAKESGADAAKFQNFRASKIVSKEGFEAMGRQLSHQARWKKSVFEVYQEASIPFEWTPVLKRCADEVGIHYFSSPYDFEAVDMLDPSVPAYKIGSGDISWPEMLSYIARKGKPVILATGASTLVDVTRAAETILAVNKDLILLQCNTNYTASLENFGHIHLNVLKTYRAMYPDLILGLSDHTPGCATVLGAVALGARVVEKHFTDDVRRTGPDHAFSMTPATWREMVDRSRELEGALGSGAKAVAGNEKETVVLQRRCLRAASDLPAGTTLTRGSIEVLRPATPGAIEPFDLPSVIGRVLSRPLKRGEAIAWSALRDAGN